MLLSTRLVHRTSLRCYESVFRYLWENTERLVLVETKSGLAAVDDVTDCD
jgi:hypothetical protein